MNKDHITGRRHDSPKRGKLLPLVLVITFGLLSLHGCGDNVGGEASLLRQGVGGEASLLRHGVGGEASLLRHGVGGEASLLRHDVGGEASSFAKTGQPTTAQMVADSSCPSNAMASTIKTAELRRPDMKVRVRRGEQLVNKYADGSVIPLPHCTNQQQSRQTGDVRFFARTGDAHDSIVRHGDGPRQYWWEVTDRTGVTHYYGHYPDDGMNAGNPAALTDDCGNIARWMLCESRDPDSNWVRYFYAVDTIPGANPGRQIYLDSI